MNKTYERFNKMTRAHYELPLHGGWVDCPCATAREIREFNESDEMRKAHAKVWRKVGKGL